MNKREEKQCHHCGEIFMRRVFPWFEKTNKFKQRRYCSIACGQIARQSRGQHRQSNGKFCVEVSA